jgi:hypothetical protein
MLAEECKQPGADSDADAASKLTESFDKSKSLA